MDISQINSQTQTRLRRLRSNLSESGTALILFGIWGVIRIVMELTMKSGTYETILDEADLLRYGELAHIVIGSILMTIILLILIFHLYIGISAIRFGSGQKKKRGFIVLAFIAMIANLYSIRGDLTNEITGRFQLDNLGAAAVIMDVAIAFVLFDIIRCVITISYLQGHGEADRS